MERWEALLSKVSSFSWGTVVNPVFHGFPEKSPADPRRAQGKGRAPFQPLRAVMVQEEAGLFLQGGVRGGRADRLLRKYIRRISK